MGRASNRVPSDPFIDKCTPKRRYLFIQSLVNAYWKRWMQHYFPSLLIRQKWHTQKRNVQVGDIVLIRDLNAVRGEWRLGEVVKIRPSGGDNIVRDVDVRYKIPTRKRSMIIRRAVQSLVVLLPIDIAN